MKQKTLFIIVSIIALAGLVYGAYNFKHWYDLKNAEAGFQAGIEIMYENCGSQDAFAAVVRQVVPAQGTTTATTTLTRLQCIPLSALKEVK